MDSRRIGLPGVTAKKQLNPADFGSTQPKSTSCRCHPPPADLISFHHLVGNPWATPGGEVVRPTGGRARGRTEESWGRGPIRIIRPISCQSPVPPSSTVTLEDLRRQFWWLGPSLRDSYIVALDGDTVTIKVIQCTWNRRTQKYEEAVARDFHALGLQVVWLPFFSEKLRAEIEKAREEAMKAKMQFDEGKFLDGQRVAEQRRETRER